MSRPVVICVDDEPSILDSLEIELRRCLGSDVRIETTERGDEAIDVLTEVLKDGDEVAVVLADYIMPGIKGDELLGEIHQLSPQTLTIMVSGQADLEAVSRTIRQARLYRYISKPWEPEDLRFTVVEAVQSYLRDRKLEQQALQLQQTNQDLAQSVQQLQQAEIVLRQQAQRAQLLNRVVQQIRNSLDLETIFCAAVAEAGTLLQTDRAKILQYLPDRQTWKIVADYCQDSQVESAVGQELADPVGEIHLHYCMAQQAGFLMDGQGFPSCLNEPLPNSWLLLPLECMPPEDPGSSMLWGGFCLERTDAATPWLDWEIELARMLVNQLAIAIQQSQLYGQVSQFNVELESQIQERTAQLQTAIQQLESAAQLKDDLLSYVSHELRTPMTNIEMTTEVLEIHLHQAGLSIHPGDRISQCLQIIRTECLRETDLINDLLDLAYLDANTDPPARSPISLELWLPSLMQPFRERAREQQQQFELNLSPNLPPLMTEVGHLERVISELVNNACKYTPAGERIVLDVNRDVKEFPLLRLCIQNSGIEILPGEQERIFEKFYRIPNPAAYEGGGTGLGLAIVRKRVNRLGGTIAVTSHSGWTIFTVQLPYLEAS